MKKIYLSAVFLLSLSMAFAAPVIHVTGDGGNWLHTSTCDLIRHQFDGDAIVITSAKTVVADNHWNTDPSKLFNKIYGMPQAGGGSNVHHGVGTIKEIQLKHLPVGGTEMPSGK